MPTAKIAIELAISQSLPTRNATAMPMIEQATAPTTSEAMGAKQQLDQRGTNFACEPRIRPAGFDELLDKHLTCAAFSTLPMVPFNLQHDAN